MNNIVDITVSFNHFFYSN